MIGGVVTAAGLAAQPEDGQPGNGSAPARTWTLSGPRPHSTGASTGRFMTAMEERWRRKGRRWDALLRVLPWLVGLAMAAEAVHAVYPLVLRPLVSGTY